MADRFKHAPGSCIGKVPHASADDARNAKVSTYERRGGKGIGGETSVYHCLNCGHWHWGHTPRTRLTQRRTPVYSRRPKHRLQETDE